MKRLQPYLPPVINLVTALAQLSCRIIRQISLPTGRKKGNLLSSLFILLTGLIEYLIGFMHDMMQVPGTEQAIAKVKKAAGSRLAGNQTYCNAWTFTRKYLRQTMLTLAWALFILSSLEWTLPDAPAPQQRNTAQLTSPNLLPTGVEQQASTEGSATTRNQAITRQQATARHQADVRNQATPRQQTNTLHQAIALPTPSLSVYSSNPLELSIFPRWLQLRTLRL